MARQKKTEETGTLPEVEKKPAKDGAALSSALKSIKKQYGNWSAGIMSDADWPDVKEWISTGSIWLNSIIKEGLGFAGYPVGRVSSLQGLSGTGKSYLAALAIAEAQRMGFLCILFDSEMAADTTFLTSLGVDVDKLVYIAVQDCEMFFEIFATLLALDEKLFVVWDTPANTKAREEDGKSFSPGSTMALKARTISKGFAKIFDLIMEKRPTVLICNQLKRNLDPNTSMIEPWVTPGGETIKYLSSLTLQLTTRKAKAHRVLGPNDQQIGSDVKVKIVKSRFGSLNRECAFKIIWNGPEKGIMDEESWVEAIESSDYLETSGAWYTLYMDDSCTEEKSVRFQRGTFMKVLEENPEFKKRVLWVIQEELVNLFQVKASSEKGKKFYNVDDDDESEESDG